MTSIIPPSEQNSERNGEEQQAENMTSDNQCGATRPPMCSDSESAGAEEGKVDQHVDLEGASPLEESERLQTRLEEKFSSADPLSLSNTVEALHEFVSTTSQFLNSFASSADAKLGEISCRISKLESQMNVLESKLTSILKGNNDEIKQAPRPLE